LAAATSSAPSATWFGLGLGLELGLGHLVRTERHLHGAKVGVVMVGVAKVGVVMVGVAKVL
jgi:hypothetical protein